MLRGVTDGSKGNSEDSKTNHPYKRFAFKVIKEQETDLLMVKEL